LHKKIYLYTSACHFSVHRFSLTWKLSPLTSDMMPCNHYLKLTQFFTLLLYLFIPDDHTIFLPISSIHHNDRNMELLLLPENLSSHPVLSGVRVAWSLVFCVMFCKSLFVFLSVFCCHYIFFPSSAHVWLSLWYFQTSLTTIANVFDFMFALTLFALFTFLRGNILLTVTMECYTYGQQVVIVTILVILYTLPY